MALTPVVRRSATDEVFEQIMSDVVGGDLVPGESLPSERRLAELLGVSRPVVREALQRIAQTGLVEVRQGGSTTVRSFGQFAGLDLLPRLMVRRGELDLAVARSILEARLSVGPDVAALAAERGSDDLGDTLGRAVDRLADATDPVAMQQHVLTFWDRVVDAADSVVFRLMFNSLRAAYEPALGALSVILQADVTRVEAYRAVVSDIAAHDVEAARSSASALLEPTTSVLLATIRELENHT